MEFELMIANLADVSEEFRVLYKKGDDGKFHLLPALAEKLGNAKTLKSNLEAANKTIKDLNAKVGAYSALGEPEAITTRLKELEAGGQGAEKWEKLKTQLNDTHSKALAAKDAELSAMNSTLSAHLVDNEATAALMEAKGSPNLLLPIIRGMTKVEKKGDRYAAHVVDAKGDPRINDKGEPLSIKELVTEMAKSKDYARAFDASDAAKAGGGAGTKPNAGPGNAGGGNKNPVAKISAGLSAVLGKK